MKLSEAMRIAVEELRKVDVYGAPLILSVARATLEAEIPSQEETERDEEVETDLVDAPPQASLAEILAAVATLPQAERDKIVAAMRK